MSGCEEEFQILTSSDPKELWQAKERIDTFYKENSIILQELENEVATLYTADMARYILNSAMNIRTTFKCPPGWKEGFPWVNMFPPAPQPEHMQNGILADLAERANNVGKEEGKTNSLKENEELEAIKTIFTLKERLASLLTESNTMEEYVEEDEDEEMNVDEEAFDQNRAIEIPTVSTEFNVSAEATIKVEATATQSRRATATMDFTNFGDDSEEEEDD